MNYEFKAYEVKTVCFQFALQRHGIFKIRNLIFSGCILLAATGCNASKVLDDSLCVHSLSCTRFSTGWYNTQVKSTSTSALEVHFENANFKTDH